MYIVRCGAYCHTTPKGDALCAASFCLPNIVLRRIVANLFRLVDVVRRYAETTDEAFNVSRTLSAWHNPIQVDSVTAILFPCLDDVVLHNVSLSSFCNNRIGAARHRCVSTGQDRQRDSLLPSCTQDVHRQPLQTGQRPQSCRLYVRSQGWKQGFLPLPQHRRRHQEGACGLA